MIPPVAGEQIQMMARIEQMASGAANTAAAGPAVSVGERSFGAGLAANRPPNAAVSDPFQTFDQMRAELTRMIEESNSTQVQEMARMLNLQYAAQDAGLAIELMSKTVEHATSGAKTILQTQA